MSTTTARIPAALGHGPHRRSSWATTGDRCASDGTACAPTVVPLWRLAPLHGEAAPYVQSAAPRTARTRRLGPRRPATRRRPDGRCPFAGPPRASPAVRLRYLPDRLVPLPRRGALYERDRDGRAAVRHSQPGRRLRASVTAHRRASARAHGLGIGCRGTPDATRVATPRPRWRGRLCGSGGAVPSDLEGLRRANRSPQKGEVAESGFTRGRPVPMGKVRGAVVQTRRRAAAGAGPTRLPLRSVPASCHEAGAERRPSPLAGHGNARVRCPGDRADPSRAAKWPGGTPAHQPSRGTTIYAAMTSATAVRTTVEPRSARRWPTRRRDHSRAD